MILSARTKRAIDEAEYYIEQGVDKPELAFMSKHYLQVVLLNVRVDLWNWAIDHRHPPYNCEL